MQNKFNYKWTIAALGLLLTGLLVISCKRTFTEPPVLGAPDIVANISIKDIKIFVTVNKCDHSVIPPIGSESHILP